MQSEPAVIATLAETVAEMRLAHPARVGIDGRSAADKTTLGDAVAYALIAQHHLAVLRASIDDFHRPGHKYRSMRGEWTSRSYCDGPYDYVAFREVLLRPLGPGGTRRCRTGLWNSFHDQPIPENWIDVDQNSVLIVDGPFLCHPSCKTSGTM